MALAQIDRPLITLARCGGSWIADFRYADPRLLSGKVARSGGEVLTTRFSADTPADEVQAFYRARYPDHSVALRLRDALELPELREVAR
jgi:hypothetical protein